MTIEINAKFAESAQDFPCSFDGGEDFEAKMDGILPGDYSGSYEVTPSEETQTLATNGRTLSRDVTVNPIPDEYVVPTGTLEISENGEADVTDYAAVDVDIQPPLQSKTVTSSNAQQTVQADDGYYGLDTVTVNGMANATFNTISQSVPPNTPTINPSTGLVTVTTTTVTGTVKPVSGAGYVDTTTGIPYSSAGGSKTLQLETKAGATITPTTSQQTAVAAGKYTLGDVKVGAIPSQYIVPSGTKSITSNGTGIDVKSYEYADVAVPTSTPTLQTVTKTYTPTTSQQTETVTAGTGYDGLEEVDITVNAMPSGSASAPSTISASGASQQVSTGTSTLTLFKTMNVTPVVSAGYVSAGTATESLVSLSTSVDLQPETTFHPSTSDQAIIAGKLLSGAQRFKAVTLSNLTADNIKSGVTVKVGDATDDDCVASVTGTYSGGGGTSKNTQVVQGTTRTTSSSMTAIGAEMTVSKTGTYDIYWSAFRSNTSSTYTYATQLYINGTAHGSENTTWSNHVQNNHLTNVSLTANQKLRVYGRESRNSSYYIYAPTLVIVEA